MLFRSAVPNPVDLRFAKVSGLEMRVETETVTEGGQNLYTQQLPQRISHGNLTLERGMVVGSPLNLEFNATMTLFKFKPCNVIVTLFGDAGVGALDFYWLRRF